MRKPKLVIYVIFLLQTFGSISLAIEGDFIRQANGLPDSMTYPDAVARCEKIGRHLASPRELMAAINAEPTGHATVIEGAYPNLPSSSPEIQNEIAQLPPFAALVAKVQNNIEYVDFHFGTADYLQPLDKFDSWGGFTWTTSLAQIENTNMSIVFGDSFYVFIHDEEACTPLNLNCSFQAYCVTNSNK